MRLFTALKALILPLALATAAFLSSCAPARTPAHGAVRGAAVGAVVGNQFRKDGKGAKGKGAAIGAAAGMAVGGSRQYRDRTRRYHYY
ncbi:MAG: glycine zipper 2TM domain-containing protein [Verrucomicrobiae bacterium]|nr:glycine zipper 2TM domain-containing protein [Verrucomicrobiae bacterium]